MLKLYSLINDLIPFDYMYLEISYRNWIVMQVSFRENKQICISPVFTFSSDRCNLVQRITIVIYVLNNTRLSYTNIFYNVKQPKFATFQCIFSLSLEHWQSFVCQCLQAKFYFYVKTTFIYILSNTKCTTFTTLNSQRAKLFRFIWNRSKLWCTLNRISMA